MITRLAIVTLTALALTTPATAQLDGLTKKLKNATSQEDDSTAAAAAPADPAGQGGTIVLTDDVLSRLVTGLKAGQVEREAAAKADTPYGRYRKATASYAEAKATCDNAKKEFPQRMARDEKLMNKYNSLVEKMIAAQQKGDQKQMAIYQDSASAMQDPSCTVKQPEQPDDYYDAQREVDARAEALEMKAAGFSAHELAVVKERVLGILLGRPLDQEASPSEKSAVAANTELKPLLGFREEPVETAKKPEPAPQPAAPSQQMPAAASDMNACMMANMQKNQAQLEALGQRMEAAQKAGDQAKMMALADTLQKLQMAGCMGR